MRMTLIRKNLRLLNLARINEPDRQPSVRKMKYRLVAKPASVRVMPTRSIRSLGAVVLVPTSMPTWHMMPRKLRRMTGLPSSLKHSTKFEAFPTTCSRSMGVTSSRREARMPMMPYTGNSTRQPRPKVGMAAVAPHMAM